MIVRFFLIQFRSKCNSFTNRINRSVKYNRIVMRKSRLNLISIGNCPGVTEWTGLSAIKIYTRGDITKFRKLQEPLGGRNLREFKHGQ